MCQKIKIGIIRKKTMQNEYFLYLMIKAIIICCNIIKRFYEENT